MRETKAELENKLNDAYIKIETLDEENRTLNREIKYLRKHKSALGDLKHRITRAMDGLQIDLDVIKSIGGLTHAQRSGMEQFLIEKIQKTFQTLLLETPYIPNDIDDTEGIPF